MRSILSLYKKRRLGCALFRPQISANADNLAVVITSRDSRGKLMFGVFESSLLSTDAIHLDQCVATSGLG